MLLIWNTKTGLITLYIPAQDCGAILMRSVLNIIVFRTSLKLTACIAYVSYCNALKAETRHTILAKKWAPSGTSPTAYFINGYI